MGYRGEDLDLRTPQTWSATAADLAGGHDPRARGSYAGRNEPIWVDETVLACCNHAYDVALLNRAGEVRLEHLLHALTRIDAAADALEARGVRVNALRRDTAAVIANDIPIALPNGKGTPRRSEQLEDVLRLAAREGARRNGPASIDDLLHVLLDVEPGLPGLLLLTRNSVRSGPYAEAPRPAFQPEPVDLRARAPAGGYYFNEPSRPLRADYLGTPTDSIQNSRLDALEQMVRAIGSDLALERKAFSTMLQDVQREVLAQRDETGRVSSGLQDRLQSVDTLIERRLGEFSRPWLQMNDRLQGLEHVVSNVRSGGSIDLGPVAERLSALERAIQNIKPSATADLAPVSDQIAYLERAVQSSASDASQRVSALADKIASFEAVLAGRAVTGDVKLDFAPLAQRLDMIEEAVLSREAATREIADQLRRQEDILAADRATFKEESERVIAEVGRITGLIDRESEETASAVLGSLTARLEGLAGVIESRHSDTAQALASNAASIAQLIERLGAAEQSALEGEHRVKELLRQYYQELAEVHDALKKINTNQHTIAGSLDQWRQDTSSTLSIMGSRMEIVEREATKPVPMIEALSATVDRMHKVTVERYYRRNRFWYWLFGTDDWVAASWPDQATRIADDARLQRPAPSRA